MIKYIIALIALIAVTAFGLWMNALGPPPIFWLLVALMGGAIYVTYEVGPAALVNFAWANGILAALAVLFLVVAMGFLGYRSYVDWPTGREPIREVQRDPPRDAPPADRRESQKAPDPGPIFQPPPPDVRKRPEEPQPARPAPMTRIETKPPSATPVIGDPGDCPPAIPNRPPNIRLHTGDLIVAGGAGIYQVDAFGKETRIVSGDYVESVRGVVVESSGELLVSTFACGTGSVVRVDPRTGSQTRLTMGARVPMGIAIEPSGSTVLFGDELGRPPTWGYLWRMELANGRKEPIHTFRGDAVATSIAIDPVTHEVFFAARAIYRMTETGPRRVDVDGVTNVHAMTITPKGEMYLADYMGGKVAHVKPGTAAPLETFGSVPSDLRSMASDGASLFVASGSGENGRVLKFNLSEPDAAPESAWAGKPGGTGVFVTMVGDLKP